MLLTLLLIAKTTAEGRPQLWVLQDASEYAIWAIVALFLYPIIAATPLTLKAWLKLIPILLLIWQLGGALAHTAEQVVHQSFVHENARQRSAIDVLRREIYHQITLPQFRHLADFLGLFAICLFIVMIQNSREREIERSKLMTQLADAKLNALRAQMHPHFLFNTLNTVATLATTNSQEAVEVLAQLSDLLRRASAADDSHFTTIREEFNLLRSYVNIMQHRFGDRVTLEINYTPDIEQVLIPVLTLQPLVENAYNHGVGPRLSGGTIQVQGRNAGNHIVLTVSDDGLGKDAGNLEKGQGMALDNIRDRLQHLYAGSANLQTSYPETGVFTVFLTLPFITSEDELEQT